LIRQQLRDGWTETQVLDYFAATYGPQVLAQPPASGFSALVWILPVIGLVGGGIFLWRLLRRWQNHPPPAEPIVTETATGSPDIAPEMLARIEQEIESRY
jgi:cytochrome c-type biogenesis protein CcmH/NrfF